MSIPGEVDQRLHALPQARAGSRRPGDWLAGHSFRLKLIAAAVLIEALVIALASVLGLRAADDRLQEQTRVHLAHVRTLLTAALTGPLEQGDRARAQEILHYARHGNGIEYGVLFDRSQRVVAEVDWQPHEAPPLGDGVVRSGAERAEARVAVMRGNDLLGSLQYGISLSALQASRAELMRRLILLGGAGVALSLALLLVFGFLLTRHLEGLARAARRIEAGDLSARVAAVSGDEIGQVAQAFNGMARVLELRIRELNASEERLALVVQGTADGVWDWDVAANATYYSPRFRALLGYSDEAEFSARFSFVGALHAEDRRRALAARAAHLASGVPFNEQFRLRCRDGTYRWFRGRGQAKWDARGKAIRFAGSLTDISAQNAAEEKLRDNEERLYYAVRGSSDGIWDWDVLRDRYYISPRFKELLGYAADQFPDERAALLAALHPEDGARVADATRRHFELRVPYDLEYRLRCRDGRHRWFRDRGQAQWDKDGKVVRFSGASSDIMAQKLAQENMRSLLAEKQALLDNALIGVWMMRNRVIVSCNRRCEEIFGYDPGELIGQSVRVIYTNDGDYERRGESVYPVLQRGDSFSADLELQRKDGSRFWAATSGRAIDPDNPHAGSIWIVADITAQRETMQALRDEKEFNDALINSLPGVFYLYDELGNMARWNANFCEVTGYPAAEISHLKVFDFVARSARPKFRRAVVRAVERGYSETETLLVTRDERELPYFLTAARIVHGERKLVIGIGMDIADRKRFEAEIRELNEQLERRVRDRTVELLAANRELEAFSYSVSHDLSAPLRGIDGFSRMLEEDYADKLDAAGRSYIGRIRGGTQRMQQLIDDMLSLSRITRDEMKREAVDLSRMALQIIADLRQNQPERRVDVRIAPDLLARGDSSLLGIALDNLLRNAWKFTAHHATARIELGVLHEQGEPVYFVRDDGAGFDMQYAGKLFAPFQRMHRVTDFEGTGIGLAIVHRIVQRHGGRIWAEAATEQGATFYFTLA